MNNKQFTMEELLAKSRQDMPSDELDRSKTFEKASRQLSSSELASKAFGIPGAVYGSEEERVAAEKASRGRKPVEPPSSFERAMSAASAVPALGIAAKGFQLASRGSAKLAPYARRAMEVFVPKTGKEAVKGTAGAFTVGGLGGEVINAYDKDIQQYAKDQFPTDPEAQQRLANRLREGLGLAFDVGFTATTQAGSRLLSPAVRKVAEPNIPVERKEAAEFMRERGAPPTTSQVLRGKESKVREGRLQKQQETANKIYNESVGLPANNKFGREEFKKASQNITQDYDKILGGKTVTLDPKFFDEFGKLFDEQMQLRQSGLVFSETRPILETLRSISNLPQNLRQRIDALADQPLETTDPNVIGESLRLIRESLPVVRAQQQAGQIQIGAPEYNRLRSMLGDAAYRTTDKDRARLLKNMQRSFDAAADRSLPKEAAQLYDVRRRFEALKTLEQAQMGAEPGVIPANRVGRVIEQVYDEGSIYGIPNRLSQVGRAGLSLGMVEPGRGTQIEGIKDVIGGIRFPLDALRARLATTAPRTAQQREREVARGAAAIVGGQNAAD